MEASLSHPPLLSKKAPPKKGKKKLRCLVPFQLVVMTQSRRNQLANRNQTKAGLRGERCGQVLRALIGPPAMVPGGFVPEVRELAHHMALQNHGCSDPAPLAPTRLFEALWSPSLQHLPASCKLHATLFGGPFSATRGLGVLWLASFKKLKLYL